MSVTLAKIKLAEAHTALRAAESALRGAATQLDSAGDLQAASVVMCAALGVGSVAQASELLVKAI